MAKPKRTNRPGAGTQGGTTRPTRNGTGPSRTNPAGAAGRQATAPRPATRNEAGPTKTAPGTPPSSEPASQSTTEGSTAASANDTNGTAKAATTSARPATNGPPSRAARVQPTAAASTGRPVVSSIRERTGTQRPANRKRYEVKKNWLQERKAVIGSVLGVILIVAILLFVAHNQGGGSGGSNVSQPVMSSLTGVSPDAFAKVGSGGVKNPFTGLPSGPVLTDNGKPELFYVGGEYCPYCAAERWSMIIALSRFGSFSGLKTMTSASNDYAPSTNTFTFVDATYTSKYITFISKEIEDQNQQPLQTLTSSEQTIFGTYDAPPYTTQQNAGGIPFIDFGNQYMTLSSGYSPALLHVGGDASATALTDAQIIQDLRDPNNAVTQAIIGNANYITAGICKLTNNQPSNVCSTSVIQQLEAQLPKNS